MTKKQELALRDDVCARCGVRPPREDRVHCETCAVLGYQRHDRRVAGRVMKGGRRCGICRSPDHQRQRCARMGAS